MSNPPLPPPPPPPPPPSEPHGGLVPIGPWPRFAARFIDGLVLLIPNLVVGAVLSDGGMSTYGTGGVDEFLAGVVSTLLGFGYAAWLEANRGQTVGKMAMGIKVIGPDGRLPTPAAAARRNAWLLLGLLPILGGIASLVIVIAIAVGINNDPFKRGLHDRYAGGTAVVRAN